MLSYIGFDTVVVNNGVYDGSSLSDLFSLMYPTGIKKFIFLSNFDLVTNSFSLEKDKIHKFIDHLTKICPRGIHGKVFYNLMLDSGSAFNRDFKRLYAVKKYSSVFCSLPIMLESSYEDIAKDINKMLYRHKAFPIFSNFDSVLNTSDTQFSYKLMRNIDAGYCLDIGYIFDPANIDIVRAFIEADACIIPKISHDLSVYEDVIDASNEFVENIGKENYYRFCHNISKCCSKINC